MSLYCYRVSKMIQKLHFYTLLLLVSKQKTTQLIVSIEWFFVFYKVYICKALFSVAANAASLNASV